MIKTKDIDSNKDFRVEQSKEKLRLSSLMINKGLNRESLIFSYLSMFYSIRLLLIDNNDDSDNYNKIFELITKYFEPTGWTSINILDVIDETKILQDSENKRTDTIITKEDAYTFLEKAKSLNDEALMRLPT